MLGCMQGNSKRPGDLIAESKMVSILADIHLAESQVESTISYPDTALMVFTTLENAIWEKHGVSGEEFRKTYNYYADNIPAMDKLYETVVDTLIAREAKYAIKDAPENDIVPDTAEPVSDQVNPENLRRSLRQAPAGFKYDKEAIN